MIVLPVTARAPKRPRAPLTCRFMCIRCGQVVSSTPDKLAEAMEPHFTDKLKFGCPHFESRRPNVSIAFFDHGLDDALFHCQRQLRHAQKQLSDQESVALTLSTPCSQVLSHQLTSTSTEKQRSQPLRRKRTRRAGRDVTRSVSPLRQRPNQPAEEQ